jgi:NAD+ synthase (glutamine-hydrolysing)
MTQLFRIRLYQMDAAVGDFDGNLLKIARAADQARADGVSMLVVPELALTGYPPEDLLLRPALIDKLTAAASMLQEISHDLTLCVGAPVEAAAQTSDWALGNNSARPASLFNSLLIYRDGEHVLSYHKQSLPNYQVFDERRYFVAGTQSMALDLDGLRLGLLVCEDVWVPDIVDATCRLSVDLILVVNASPFAEGKFGERLDNLKHRASVQSPM